ncbi:cytochrome P450 [Zopfia rhizophila CBS 207.26]|uniref:Cytochrome P450 n=1 Tax=Zopfia rhizophila CBS 207.26 TaxID=1314779 RepID=A0A6A6E6J3_9PEZI|nr:cytochrome P450 [Zopfia rhizophila CBS 207.26]
MLYLVLATLSSLCFLHYIITWCKAKRLQHTVEAGKVPPWASEGLPLVGNSVAFLRDPFAFVLSLSSKHPVRLRLPGANPILVQGLDNVRTLFRLSAWSNPAHAQQFIASRLFGMPPVASASFVRDNSGIAAKPKPGTNVESRNRICHRDHEIIRSMFQGPELSDLIDRFSGLLYEKMHHLPIGSQWVEMPDLFEFLVTQITPLSIELLCGPSLTKVIDPDFVRDFWRFDSWVPTIAKKAPRWIFPQGYRIRDKLIASIKRWRMSSCMVRDDEKNMTGCKGMKDKLNLLDVDGWDMDAIAASDLGLIWAANSNTISCLYWMTYEIFRRPSLLAHIQRECSESISKRSEQLTPKFELTTLLSQPYLQSSFAETLRYRCHIFITRYPDSDDMYVNGWRLPAGSLLMACSTVQHMEESLWNTKTYGKQPLNIFWPERFLTLVNDHNYGYRHRKESAISLSYDVESSRSDQSSAPKQQPKFTSKGLEGVWVPFGGGSQMCPGQRLAKVQVFLTTALITTLFEVEPSDPRKEIPVNWAHFGTGVAKPAAPLPFRIRRRPA